MPTFTAADAALTDRREPPSPAGSPPPTRSSSSGVREQSSGTRRAALPRLRRRNRRPERRARASQGGGRDRTPSGAPDARVFPGNDVRGVRRGGRSLEPSRAGPVAEENAAAFDRRGGDRKCGEDRARIHATARGYRLPARLPRTHAAGADDDRQERTVQTALRSVLQRDLPRAVPLRASRDHHRTRARVAARNFRGHRRGRPGGGDRLRARPGRGWIRSGAARAS